MDETEFDLRTLLGLLRRQFRLIAITIIAIVAVASVVVFTLPPVYTSSALILVDPSRKNLLEPDAQMTSASADSARIDSEVELIRSDNVLMRVIQNQNLTQDPEFGVSLSTWTQILAFFKATDLTLPTGEEALNQALSRLRNAVGVQRRGVTYLVSVQVSSQSRSKAADLANALTQAYIADQLASKVNSTLASRDILQARIIQARDSIVSSENNFDTFISENIANITANSANSNIANMQAQLSQLEQARQQNLSTATAADQYLAGDDWSSLVQSLQSDALTQLETQRQQLSASLGSTNAGSPAELDLRAELSRIEDQLRVTSTQQVTQLRSSVQTSEQQEEQIRQNMRSAVLDSNLSADVLTRLYELQQNAELARTQYQTLLSRVQDLEAQADLQLADSRIVSPALPPQSPSFPNKVTILALAAFAAMAVGIAMAFLYENLIGGFTSEGQMESVLRVPVVAVLPRAKGKSERDSIANMMVTSPLSIFAESVRRLRAAVEQTLRLKAPTTGSVIMVTSTAPNEGKTTVSLSLARSYALSGRRTLLIDCDLRKPSVHRHLELEPSQGLLELLSHGDDKVDLSNVISKDTLTGATVIIGARRSDLPTDQLLAGESFARLIRAARNSFDVIVLDTPPVGPVVDALYIAPLVDLIVFVTRWASTSQLDARRSVEGLRTSKMPDTPIVTILNQQDEPRASYQRKYGAYYSQAY